MSSIVIREVGPRDGLQPEEPVSVADRLRLIHALIDAGVTEIEVAAFVSPKAVPAMSGAAELMASLGRPPGVRRWALVPNVRGAQMALAAGVDAITVTLSASETYSQRNVHMSVAESSAEVARICASSGSSGSATASSMASSPASSPESSGGVPVDVVVSCAFGSPYEGDLDPAVVGGLGASAQAAGAASVTYADTTGMATPRRVTELLAVTGPDVGLHLHETRGTALVNAYAAMEAGVARFDTSIGGLGGSPFAAGAGGNLATEDLVHLCDDIGVTTGLDLDRLLAASELVASLVGRPVPSHVAHAGPRLRLA